MGKYTNTMNIFYSSERITITEINDIINSKFYKKNNEKISQATEKQIELVEKLQKYCILCEKTDFPTDKNYKNNIFRARTLIIQLYSYIRRNNLEKGIFYPEL